MARRSLPRSSQCTLCQRRTPGRSCKARTTRRPQACYSLHGSLSSHTTKTALVHHRLRSHPSRCSRNGASTQTTSSWDQSRKSPGCLSLEWALPSWGLRCITAGSSSKCTCPSTWGKCRTCTCSIFCVRGPATSPSCFAQCLL